MPFHFIYILWVQYNTLPLDPENLKNQGSFHILRTVLGDNVNHCIIGGTSDTPTIPPPGPLHFPERNVWLVYIKENAFEIKILYDFHYLKLFYHFERGPNLCRVEDIFRTTIRKI